MMDDRGPTSHRLWGYWFNGVEADVISTGDFATGEWVPAMLVAVSATARTLYLSRYAPLVRTGGVNIPLSAGDATSWLDTVFVGPFNGKIARVAVATVAATLAQWNQWKTGLYSAAQVFPTGLVSSKPLNGNFCRRGKRQRNAGRSRQLSLCF